MKTINFPKHPTISGSISLPEHIDAEKIGTWWEAYYLHRMHSGAGSKWENSVFSARYRGAVAFLQTWGSIDLVGFPPGELTPDGKRLDWFVFSWLGSTVDTEVNLYANPFFWQKEHLNTSQTNDGHDTQEKE